MEAIATLRAKTNGERTMEAFICDAVRTPLARYAGGLAYARADDLAAIPIKALMARNGGVDWAQVEEVYLGCANQAGEDNRNVARMAALLAGLPESVAGVTVNRLCASGLAAIVGACHAVIAGDGDLFVAGGVESMSRAPLVTAKPAAEFDDELGPGGDVTRDEQPRPETTAERRAALKPAFRANGTGTAGNSSGL